MQKVVIDKIDFEILEVRKQDQVDAGMAKEIADRVRTTREGEPGIEPHELLRLPDRRYFRRRGIYAFSLITPEGDEVPTAADLEAALARSLPEPYLDTEDFRGYVSELRAHHAGLDLASAGSGFRL